MIKLSVRIRGKPMAVCGNIFNALPRLGFRPCVSEGLEMILMFEKKKEVNNVKAVI